MRQPAGPSPSPSPSPTGGCDFPFRAFIFHFRARSLRASEIHLLRVVARASSLPHPSRTPSAPPSAIPRHDPSASRRLYIASGEIPVAGYGREESRSRRESIREMPPARRTAVKASYSKYWPTIFHLLSRRRLRKLRAEAAKRNCRSLVEIFHRGKVKGRVSGIWERQRGVSSFEARDERRNRKFNQTSRRHRMLHYYRLLGISRASVNNASACRCYNQKPPEPRRGVSDYTGAAATGKEGAAILMKMVDIDFSLGNEKCGALPREICALYLTRRGNVCVTTLRRRRRY